ncbi:winged helix-turn-helix domain-containing protein [Streptomyces sp. NPDC054784]
MTEPTGGGRARAGPPPTPRLRRRSSNVPQSAAAHLMLLSPRTGITVDTECHTATVDGRELDLTYLEFELLAHLVAHPHRVHSRELLTEAVWGHTYVGDGRTVDVHVARLRRKLGAPHRDRIITVRRVGYKYVPGSRHG